MSKWIATLIVFFPLSVHQLDFRSRFTSGLNIKMKHSSPAYAALEDINQTFSDAERPPVVQEVSPLSTGKLRLHMTATSTQRMALKTLVIRQSFQARAPLQAGMDIRTETP